MVVVVIWWWWRYGGGDMMVVATKTIGELLIPLIEDLAVRQTFRTLLKENKP